MENNLPDIADYCYDGDEGTETECNDQQSEAESHICARKEAYDRYMEMILKRACEIASEQQDLESST